MQSLLITCLAASNTDDFSGPGGLQAQASLRQHLYYAAEAVGGLSQDTWTAPWHPPTTASLSARKMEVLHTLWQLLDMQLTWQRLNMRENTFRKHVSELNHFFGVSNWSQALRAAQWQGLLPRGLPGWQPLDHIHLLT